MITERSIPNQDTMIRDCHWNRLPSLSAPKIAASSLGLHLAVIKHAVIAWAPFCMVHRKSGLLAIGGLLLCAHLLPGLSVLPLLADDGPDEMLSGDFGDFCPKKK
ncbi:hypothetical protein CEXT_657971 [Caerostris extrusa]|uniref:Uncharacterized protein n=1 Tax=Caerostris extrusa TaxID=172846 RepID=A0AAV4VS13_CAEEX|nr:hypothetical protein CEXT_657971 [Caerostris extrusa]